MNSKRIETIAFSQDQRPEFIKRLRNTVWDIVVIGGGITGAGVALEAVVRSLRVAVIECRDFASGTSSRSTKMAHGGLRYVAKFELGLVREAATERNWLRDVGLPHMTRPVQFLYPILKASRMGKQELPKSKEGFGKMRLATFLYDAMCGFHNYAKRQIVKDPGKAAELEPALDSSRLVGAALYYDTNVDDARLVVETLKEAIHKGQAVALNYARVDEITHDADGHVNGIEAIDEVDPQKPRIRVRGKVVVNATGVWADDILGKGDRTHRRIIRPTKGVHLAYQRRDLPVNRALILRSIDDDRIMFVLPRNDWVVIGTTDTDYSGDYVKCYCDGDDADYLRRTVLTLFPHARIGNDRLLGTYAGLRPLVSQEGKSESDVSRKHIILRREDGLLSLLGGKLTTFRRMAQDLFLKQIAKEQEATGLPAFSTKKSISKIRYTVAITKEDWAAAREVKRAKLHPVILRHLYEEYGRGGLEILRQVEAHRSLGKRLLDNAAYPVEVCPWILAEVDYVVRHEATVHLDDVLCRRTEICWLVRPEYQGHIAALAASHMKKLLDWSTVRTRKEIDDYLEYVKKNSFFFKGNIPVPSIAKAAQPRTQSPDPDPL
jgi:glycerol-3-phosphate dehydrogenase